MFNPRLLLAAGLCLWPLAAASQCSYRTVPATTPTSQFVIHGDGTVTDKGTGLMWQRCLNGLSGDDCKSGYAHALYWGAALGAARALNAQGGYAGFTDWRLPNVNELSSILEEQCSGPALNLAVFPRTPSFSPEWQYTALWSSTPYAFDGQRAMIVDFDGGYVDADNKIQAHPVRLVRGGR